MERSSAGSGNTRLARRRTALVTAAIVACGTMLAALLHQHLRALDLERIEGALALRAEWRAFDLKSKINAELTPVSALALFLSSQQNLTDAQFDSFATEIGRFGMRFGRLAWEPRVTAAERGAFEAAARASGLSGFRITELSPDGRFVTAAERDEYFPIRFEKLEPRYPSALGFDVASDPERRQTVERARDAGQPIAVEPGLRAASLQGSPTRIIFWPLYRGPGVPEDVAERRDRLSGYVTALVQIGDLLNNAVRNTPDLVGLISIEIAEGGPSGPRRPVGHFLPGSRELSTGAPPVLEPGSLRLVRDFSVLNQEWTVTFLFPAELVRQMRSGLPALALALGLALTAAIALYAAVLLRRQDHVMTLVSQRTASLARTADQLAAARDELRAIMENTVDGIVTLDTRGRITGLNGPAALLLDRAPEAMVGLDVAALMAEPDGADYAAALADFARSRSTSLLGSVREVTGRRPDGTTFPMEIAVGAIPGGRGFVATLRDITRRRTVEDQLKQAQKMEALGRLTGGVAHDFNNLLAVILGNLEMLTEDTAGREDLQELLQAATAAIRRGRDLTRQLLTFSQRRSVSVERFDPCGVADSLTSLLQRTLGEGITITVRAGAEPLRIATDRGLFESALINLALNARDAMAGRGRLTIAIEARPVAPELAARERIAAGDFIAVTVRDTGTGMSPAVAAQAFEPFFTTKSGTGGSGLGLSMVYGFVRKAGGAVLLDTAVGEGTAITLLFPSAPAQPEAMPTPAAGYLPAAAGRRILVVEDNPDLRQTLTRILGRLGHRVERVETGEAALARLGTLPAPDLMLCDMALPGAENGLDVAEAATRRCPGLAVVLMSGHGETPESRLRLETLGLTLLAKPFDSESLADAIQHAIRSGARVAP